MRQPSNARAASAKPRLFDVHLPPLALLRGGTVEPHVARGFWWGPEGDLPGLEARTHSLSERRATRRRGPGARAQARPHLALARREARLAWTRACPRCWWCTPSPETRVPAGQVAGGSPSLARAGHWTRLTSASSASTTSAPVTGALGRSTRRFPRRRNSPRGIWPERSSSGWRRWASSGWHSSGVAPSAAWCPCASVRSEAPGWNGFFHSSPQPPLRRGWWPGTTCSAPFSNWTRAGRHDVGRGLELARQAGDADLPGRAGAGRQAGPAHAGRARCPLSLPRPGLARAPRPRSSGAASMGGPTCSRPAPWTTTTWTAPRLGFRTRVPLWPAASCVDVDTDQLFTTGPGGRLADRLTAHGAAHVERATVHSLHGHDAFLLEWDALTRLFSAPWPFAGGRGA